MAVPIGRPDASSADPEGRLPAETLGAAELRACFAAKGLSDRQLVALSGAHTIGGKVGRAAAAPLRQRGQHAPSCAPPPEARPQSAQPPQPARACPPTLPTRHLALERGAGAADPAPARAAGLGSCAEADRPPTPTTRRALATRRPSTTPTTRRCSGSRGWTPRWKWAP
jgi:hypothetical protein